MTLQDHITRLGLQEIGTGGNCTGLQRVMGDVEILVTAKDEPLSPDTASAPCTVSVFDYDTGAQIVSFDLRSGLESIEALRQE